jgi:predicted nucleic acid-binding protein
LRVLADTGPLVAAANRRDRAHDLAAALVTELGRELLILDPIIVEVDQLLRARVNRKAGLAFLSAVAQGEHVVEFMTRGLVRRASAIDAKYRDLDLGFVDAALMAYAERHDLPILTFDFEDFRSARPEGGNWRLVVDEQRYREAVD